jgi:5-formyltetrahydrofolate cyclo-ligase
MDSGPVALKSALRAEVRARLAKLTEKDREKASEQALSLIHLQDAWKKARFVLFYAPLNGELDLWPLLGQALQGGKEVALPRYDPERGGYVACQITELTSDLEMGRYGIREPRQSCASVPLNRLDFALIPGVAFDLHGCRLGRGQGYYDRLLAGMCGRICGVAFDEQIVGTVPVQPHDSDVNCILTPTRWIEL